MIELPEPLLKALDEQPGHPPRFVDPRTKQSYVLVPAEWYERLKTALQEDDLDGIDVGRLIDEAMREDDENDPWLDSYQKYKKNP
jgi:hypothetical protein